MKINSLSASGYGCHNSCNWLYYLKYDLGFEDESGPSAFLGTLSHTALEIFSKASINKHPRNSKIFDPYYMWDICFNHYYNKEPYTAEQLETAKIKKVCKGYHELVNSDYSPIRDNTISAEAAFDIPIEGKEFFIKETGKQFSLRGRIDRVDRIDDETIEILDYKSGSRDCFDAKIRHKKTPIDLFEDIQPKMYHLAAKHLYPFAKNIIVTFIYFTDGGAVSVPFCDSDIYDTREILKKRFRTIQSDNDPQRHTSWRCKNFCYFGQKTGICKSVWDEKEEVGHKFIENKYHVLNKDRRKK